MILLLLGMEKTVLVVEDDVDLIGIYREILELHQYNVETALNGQEGVEKFKRVQPSLVIMDGDMPVLDGYEAFNQIKAIDNKANVVIVTGFSEFEPKSQEAIKNGLIKVISKIMSNFQIEFKVVLNSQSNLKFISWFKLVSC